MRKLLMSQHYVPTQTAELNQYIQPPECLDHLACLTPLVRNAEPTGKRNLLRTTPSIYPKSKNPNTSHFHR